MVFVLRGGPYPRYPCSELRNWVNKSEITPGAHGLSSRTHGPRSIFDVNRTAGGD